MDVTHKDIAWTYVAKFITLGVNIILLPMILSYLTDTELALWYVFASISQVVSLFDFGFSPAMSRHMTYAWSGARELAKVNVGEYGGTKRNDDLVAKVYRTCVAVYLTVSVCALLVMLTLGSVYIYEVLDHDFSGRILTAWLVYAFSVFLNIYYGYWSSLLQGIGAIAEKNKMNVYGKLIQIAVAVVLLVMGYGLLGFVISYALGGISLRLIGRRYFIRCTKGIDLKKKIPIAEVKKTFFTIWYTAWKDGVVTLAQYMCTQANTLVCAYYVDLSSTNSYGVLTQVFSTLAAVASALYSTYQPLLGSANLQRDIKKQRIIVCKTGFAFDTIYILITIAFLAFGIPILQFIKPNLSMDIWLIIGIGFFYYQHQRYSVYCSMISAANTLPFCRSFVITACVSILMSICATKYLKLGLWGLILSQIIADLAYNSWKWPRVMLKSLDLKYGDVWKIGFHNIRSIQT